MRFKFRNQPGLSLTEAGFAFHGEIEMVNWSPVYLIVEENPNCSADERVFSTSGEKKPVKRLHLPNPKTGQVAWCDVAAINDNGQFTKAFAHRVEDSSDGTAWLIFGDTWGLRLRADTASWDLNNPSQWGFPFIVLDSSGTSIDFE